MASMLRLVKFCAIMSAKADAAQMIALGAERVRGLDHAIQIAQSVNSHGKVRGTPPKIGRSTIVASSSSTQPVTAVEPRKVPRGRSIEQKISLVEQEQRIAQQQAAERGPEFVAHQRKVDVPFDPPAVSAKRNSQLDGFGKYVLNRVNHFDDAQEQPLVNPNSNHVNPSFPGSMNEPMALSLSVESQPFGRSGVRFESGDMVSAVTKATALGLNGWGDDVVSTALRPQSRNVPMLQQQEQSNSSIKPPRAPQRQTVSDQAQVESEARIPVRQVVERIQTEKRGSKPTIPEAESGSPMGISRRTSVVSVDAFADDGFQAHNNNSFGTNTSLPPNREVLQVSPDVTPIKPRGLDLVLVKEFLSRSEIYFRIALPYLQWGGVLAVWAFVSYVLVMLLTMIIFRVLSKKRSTFNYSQIPKDRFGMPDIQAARARATRPHSAMSTTTLEIEEPTLLY